MYRLIVALYKYVFKYNYYVHTSIIYIIDQPTNIFLTILYRLVYYEYSTYKNLVFFNFLFCDLPFLHSSWSYTLIDCCTDSVFCLKILIWRVKFNIPYSFRRPSISLLFLLIVTHAERFMPDVFFRCCLPQINKNWLSRARFKPQPDPHLQQRV